MRIVTILFLFVALISCGIENFDSLTELNPPLALKATSSNKEIQLSFSAYNNEAAFGGYNIYIGLSDYDVQQKKYLLKNTAGEIPFIQEIPFYSVKTIEMTITKNTQSNPFQTGEILYLGVTAYNVQTGVDSKTSNVTNITVQD